MGKQSSGGSIRSETAIDTTNILFVCGGAFSGLEGLISRRLANSEATTDRGEATDRVEAKVDEALLQQVETSDLVAYGLIPEFLGRMPVVCCTDQLGEAQLVRVLTEPVDSLWTQYQLLFWVDG